QLARLPRVEAVGSVSSLPLSNMMAWGPITIEGRVAAPNERFINVDQRAVGRDYFRVMEIPLQSGRPFNDQDARTSPRVALIDDRMAREFWPAGDAIGKRIRTGGIDASSTAPWITIVGVVALIDAQRTQTAAERQVGKEPTPVV